MADSPDIASKRNLRTIFLDRDGVLNEKMPEGRWVTEWDDFNVLPGVPEAIARLNQKGLQVIVVSNQRGIALGLFSVADVEAIHTQFQSMLEAHGARVDAFYYCPHDRLQCNCRKPLPGMFLQARSQFPAITAATSAMFGDSLPDIEFGRRLGMLTVYIDGDPDRQKPEAKKAAELATLRFPSLAAAVDALLEGR